MTSDTQARLDRAVAERRLLDHPFYQAWSAGTLERDDLRFYSTQYWRQVESFPAYLETLADRVEGAPEKIVRNNLADERDQKHPELWLDFAAAVGASRAEVEASPVEPETAACVESFSSGTREGSPVYALGMLYGYESQTPAIAATKVKGLRENYGIDGPGLTYFELHGELDVEHAGDLASAIAEVATDDESIDDAVAGARAGADAIWGLLDGVARVTGC